MMLRPFRIRNLYGQDYGVVQVTAPQYETTITSQPDAALTYLDEDDGEVITIGSSFELGQKLDEPVLELLSADDNPMHIFDIRHSAASLATWREHEAYTSKVLRRKSSGSVSPVAEPTSPTDLGMWTTDQQGRPIYDRYVVRDPLQPPKRKSHIPKAGLVKALTTREDGPRSPILDYSTASIEHPRSRDATTSQAENCDLASVLSVCGAGEEDRPSPTSSAEAANVPASTTVTASSAFIAETPAVKLDEILVDALQGLDNHLDGFASFLDMTAKSLRNAAERTRDTDTSEIEGLLGGFKSIFSEVGKIGQSMLESLDTEASALAKNLAPLLGGVKKQDVTKAQSPETMRPAPPDKSNGVPKTLSDTPVVMEQHASRQTPLPCKIYRSPSHGSGSCPDRLIDYLPAGKPTQTVVPPNFSVLNDCPAAPLPISQLKPKVCPNESANLRPQIVQHSSLNSFAPYTPKDLFSNNLCEEQQRNLNSGTPPSSTSTDGKVEAVFPTHHIPPSMPKNNPASRPMSWDTKSDRPENIDSTPTMAKHMRLKNPFPTYPIQPSMPKPKPLYPAMSWEDETRRGESRPSKSILDLETSDPDFSSRFPPLMSLRRARTVGGLSERALSSAKASSNAQAALARYPSIDQLEKNSTDRRPEVTNTGITKKAMTATVEDEGATEEVVVREDAPGAATLRYSYPKKTTESKQETASEENASTLLSTNTTRRPFAAVKPLPGAWPEPLVDPTEPKTASKGESSGAFFDRMTRNRRANGPNPTVNTPTDIRPLNETRPAGFRYIDNREELRERHQKQSGLNRSHTVTSSNPAARLTRPFDPFARSWTGHRYGPPLATPSVPLFSRESVELPRRSGTERLATRPRRGFGHMPGTGRPTFDPFSPDPASVFQRQTSTNSPPRGPRPMRSEPQFNVRLPESEPCSNSISQRHSPRTSDPRSSVDDCIKQLRAMGYGANDLHEASRLNVYAAASSGDVTDAIDMIEEDRKVAFNVWRGRNRSARDDSLI